jgi:hypothetical protein
MNTLQTQKIIEGLNSGFSFVYADKESEVQMQKIADSKYEYYTRGEYGQQKTQICNILQIEHIIKSESFSNYESCMADFLFFQARKDIEKKNYEKAIYNYNLAIEWNLREGYFGMAYCSYLQNDIKRAKEYLSLSPIKEGVYSRDPFRSFLGNTYHFSEGSEKWRREQKDKMAGLFLDIDPTFKPAQEYLSFDTII